MASSRQDGDRACDWRAALEARVSIMEDTFEARFSVLEDAVAELNPARHSGGGDSGAQAQHSGGGDTGADNPADILFGQFGVVSTEDDEDTEEATDNAIVSFLRNPKKVLCIAIANSKVIYISCFPFIWLAISRLTS